MGNGMARWSHLICEGDQGGGRQAVKGQKQRPVALQELIEQHQIVQVGKMVQKQAMDKAISSTDTSE
jgi:hypothetical protein